ncbi:MAG: AAA family ATPase [Nitrospiraceae bacterium]|nr:AAA family ATPase [Nitrospiraceae bacterium]
MAFTIAFAGKGGTGKTSLAGLTIKYLLKHNKQPILAVDADSNACLNEALGLKVHATVGRLREESLDAVRSGERPGGMAMEELFDYQVQQSLIESKGVDLMVMGRPEGPGCYCAANNIIRKYTDILSDKYPYAVIDNEAGMEHLSRRTTHAVDVLIIVSDPTVKGLQTAKRINELVDELKLDINKRVLVVNRVSDSRQDELQKLAQSLDLEIGAMIPQDSEIAEVDLRGRPVVELPDDAVSFVALSDMLDKLSMP